MVYVKLGGFNNEKVNQALGIDLMLYGTDELNENENTSIFEAIHQFLMESDRLSKQLFI